MQCKRVFINPLLVSELDDLRLSTNSKIRAKVEGIASTNLTETKTEKKCVREDLSLDYYLFEFAKKSGKITGGVETVEDRCSYARNLPPHLGAFVVYNFCLEFEKDQMNHDLVNTVGIYNDAKLYQTNSFEEEKPNTREEIKTDSRTKKLDKLATQFNDFKFDELMERNKKMVDKMYEILLTSEPNIKFFFAFGVDHFQGSGSVNELLEEKGFKVERVTADLN